MMHKNMLTNKTKLRCEPIAWLSELYNNRGYIVSSIQNLEEILL